MIVVIMGEERTPFRAPICHLSGKKPVGRLKRRWVDNLERNAIDLGL